MSALSSPKLPGDVEKTRAREWEWDMWDMDMAKWLVMLDAARVARFVVYLQFKSAQGILQGRLQERSRRPTKS